MEPAYVHLEWDSSFFGFKVARILLPRIDNVGLKAVLQELREQNYRLAFWFLPPLQAHLHAVAVENQGILVDEKLTYVKEDISTATSALIHSCSPVPYRSTEPSPALLALAIQSGEYSRFRTDPSFPSALFEKLYFSWIARSVTREIAKEVLVVECQGDAVGMITLGEKNMRADIGLIAVSKSERGRGIGKDLIRSAESFFAHEGLKTMQVVTQRANAAACGLYESCGFRREKVENVFHFWL